MVSFLGINMFRFVNFNFLQIIAFTPFQELSKAVCIEKIAMLFLIALITTLST